MQLYFYNGQSTNYQITKDEKLYNTKTKKWLKGQIQKNGYVTYNITLEDNIIRTNISKCCNGHIRSYKGFVWKFI